MASKKQGISVSAGSPIDFVSAAGTVRVALDFISWNEFSRIDFGGWLQSSPGCRSQLIKPSELAVGLILKLSRLQKLSCQGSILKVLANGTDLSWSRNCPNCEKLLTRWLKNIFTFLENMESLDIWVLVCAISFFGGYFKKNGFESLLHVPVS
jgi:hypothetical protein